MSLFGCSAVIVEKDRSSTGQTILARNMDYMGLGYLQDYTLITIYQQPGKKAFASIGFPGTIGVISGINDAGLLDCITGNHWHHSRRWPGLRSRMVFRFC